MTRLSFSKLSRTLMIFLLCLMFVISGCSKAEQPVPEDLLFFTQSMEDRDRDEIRNAFKEITWTTADSMDSPYLISCLSKLKAQVPEFDSEGTLTGFTAEPYYSDLFRVVFPGEDSASALIWDTTGRKKEAEAWQGDASIMKKAVWDGGYPFISVRDVTNTEQGVGDLARKMQRQWVSEMFATDFYQVARGDVPLTYDQNPLIYPANPDYFRYEVMPASRYFNTEDASETDTEESDQEEYLQDTEEAVSEDVSSSDYCLLISTREAQNYAQNLKSSRLGYTGSAGEAASGKNIVFTDYTFTRYEIAVIVDYRGCIKQTIVNVDIRFMTLQDGETVSARERCQSVWSIDPYPQAEQLGYRTIIQQMTDGTFPDALFELTDTDPDSVYRYGSSDSDVNPLNTGDEVDSSEEFFDLNTENAEILE